MAIVTTAARNSDHYPDHLYEEVAAPLYFSETIGISLKALLRGETVIAPLLSSAEWTALKAHKRELRLTCYPEAKLNPRSGEETQRIQHFYHTPSSGCISAAALGSGPIAQFPGPRKPMLPFLWVAWEDCCIKYAGNPN